MIELGVNIDHVATLREARRTHEPDPVWAAVEAHLNELTNPDPQDPPPEEDELDLPESQILEM